MPVAAQKPASTARKLGRWMEFVIIALLIGAIVAVIGWALMLWSAGQL